MRFPLLSKVAAIAAVVVVLMIALTRIGWLVDERRSRQMEALQSVEQSSAGAQTLLGPLLHRVCVEEWDTHLGTEKREFSLYAIPERLGVQGAANIEAHHRGLFKVNGYASRMTLQASWRDTAGLTAQREHAGSTLQCGDTMLMVALSDARGVRSAQLLLDGQPLALRAGTLHPKYPRGLHAVLPAISASAPLSVQLGLELVGTGQLAFVPLADAAEISMRSDWPHPSFGGRFLPVAQEVTQAGFMATWRVSALASSAATDLLKGVAPCSLAAGEGCMDTLGVSFIDPVNPYVLSDRAIKYGLLFIVLTFVAVALVEVLARRRVHPIQYLLVGLALSLFFLLLLSLSEHLSFDASYAIAAGAGVALLAFYASHTLGGVKAGVLFGGAVALLYGALYTLLQMEQTALLIGSGMLFGVLATVMILTRNVDWYELFDGLRAASAPPPRADPRSAGLQDG